MKALVGCHNDMMLVCDVGDLFVYRLRAFSLIHCCSLNSRNLPYKKDSHRLLHCLFCVFDLYIF